jgi:O-methyltransferase involved in polyketide biosynthesis
VEDRKKQDAVLADPRAEEIVAAIDYDFARFDNLPSLTGAVLRTRLTRATNAPTTAWPAGSTWTCPG